ncbi:competence protein CoiA family protein [Streptomyces erythrochromogenes]|uniref:competence protein CoiA family protein n=1 Tax=Streptomyces erythrochromogenes TaxID=285574 RepID=UPI003439A956
MTVDQPKEQAAVQRAFQQEKRQVWARDRDTGNLLYLPDGQADGEVRPGVTWRSYTAGGMLLCPMRGCGPFGRVVASPSRRHHFAHRSGADHASGTGPETLWHLSAKELLARWAATDPALRGWQLHIDDTPITMPEGWRRPDVLAVSPDGSAQVAFEVQYSELTGEQWRERHRFYARAGVVDIWFFAHHGPQWRTRAASGPARRAELAHRDSGWTTAVGLSGLHQAMLQDGIVPLWLDPTAQTAGTATALFAPAAPPRGRTSRLVRDPALYVLPPEQDFRACYVAADPLEECRVDLSAGELLTPARARQREEHTRLLADQEEARQRLAALQERRHRDNELRREQEQRRRQEKAEQYAAEQEEAQRQADLRAAEEQRRREEEHAAAQARLLIPLSEQYPPMFDHDPPAPDRTRGWWRLRRRRRR